MLRRVRSRVRPSQIFIGLSVLETMVVIIGILVAAFSSDGLPASTDAADSMIALLSIEHALFSLFLSVSAAIKENKYMLIAYFFVQAETVFRVFFLLDDLPLGYDIGMYILLGWQVLLLVTGVYVYKSMGWKFWKSVGLADPRLRDGWSTYQIVQTMLTTDLQVAVRLVLTSFFLYSSYGLSSGEALISCWYVISELVWEVLLRYGIWMEKKVPTVSSLVLMMLNLGFVLVLLLKDRDNTDHTFYAAFIYPAAVSVLLTRLGLLYSVNKAIQNFGIGMRELVYPKILSGPLRRLMMKQQEEPQQQLSPLKHVNITR